MARTTGRTGMTGAPGGGTSSSSSTSGGDNIVPMRAEPTATEPLPKPQGLSRLHGLATAGMAICALIGILAMLAFITVRWPGNGARFVVGLLVSAIVGFLLCCTLAVFSAARDTYSRRGISVGRQEE